MELQELIFFYLHENTNTIEVQFRLSIDSDEEIRTDLIDLNEGISIISDNNSFGFSVGKCYNVSNIKSSACYLICSNLKYSENIF